MIVCIDILFFIMANSNQACVRIVFLLVIENTEGVGMPGRWGQVNQTCFLWVEINAVALSGASVHHQWGCTINSLMSVFRNLNSAKTYPSSAVLYQQSTCNTYFKTFKIICWVQSAFRLTIVRYPCCSIDYGSSIVSFPCWSVDCGWSIVRYPCCSVDCGS